MELSTILTVYDNTNFVNLREIEVSDYYLWNIPVIPEIKRDFQTITSAKEYGSVWLLR